MKTATIRSMSDFDIQIFPLDMFPLYLVRGERNVLIDAGVAWFSSEVVSRLEEALAGDPLDGVLLTHSHYDHVGTLPAIQKRWRLPVMASVRGADLLRRADVTAFVDRMNRSFSELHGKDVVPYTGPEGLVALGPGSRVHLGAERWLEVIPSPGHTRCSVSYLLQPDGVLFPGDSVGVWERTGGNKPLFLSSYRDYVQSLDTLAGLRARALALCHNRMVVGEDAVAQMLSEAKASAGLWAGRMRERLRAEGVDHLDRMALAVLRESFPNPTVMGPMEALQLNVEAMLRVLVREGE